MKSKALFIFLIICFLLIVSFSCKHDVAGCSDQEASNWDTDANLNDGSCVYPSIIKDQDFENGTHNYSDDWSTLQGNGISSDANPTSIREGFMPTSGLYYFKCVPYAWHGTSTTQHNVK